MMRPSLLALCLILCSATAVAAELPRSVTSETEMVVTAHPLATRAGAEVLAAGGSAVDAMIAAQAVLGLVEPQSSGIGGGAFVVYHEGDSGRTTTFDARETAPSAASADRFLDEDGEPLGFLEAWQSGLAVGVPGVPRLMGMLHDRYGRQPWPELFEPAMTLARQGFELSRRSHDQIAGLLRRNASCDAKERLFLRDPEAFRYFVEPETCSARPAGTRLRNPGYARTLALLAEEGADAFYRGDLAKAIVAAVTGDPHRPGDMRLEDLAVYEVLEREPVCLNYRDHEVCGMGPPSSGGLAVGQILGILENFELGAFGDPLAVDAVHLFSQAGRLAFADRNRYVGDPAFVDVPVAGMLDEAYLARRAQLIQKQDMGEADAGTPPGEQGRHGADERAKDSGTSHISIIDQYGNALSMTTSVESSFGNGVMVPGWGFFLNNQLTDFSFRPRGEQGQPVANRVEGGKRPRSSMAPTLVLDEAGAVRFVTGSPGGSRIIGYTAQSLVNMIDFGLDPQQAVNVPHYMNRNSTTDLEPPRPGVTRDYPVDQLVQALEQRQHQVQVLEQTSGLSVIEVGPDGFVGGRDLRRDGTASGR